MPGPGRAFFCQPLVVCTPQALLLYEPSAFPWSSPFYTSGTITASHMQFPPHLTEQENHNLPHSPLQATSPFSPSYTSGTITASHIQFPPHLTEQENHNLPHSPLQTTPPLFPILHIRREIALPHTFPSSSVTSGQSHSAKAKRGASRPSSSAQRFALAAGGRSFRRRCANRSALRTDWGKIATDAQIGPLCARTGEKLQPVRRKGVFAHGLLLQ